MVKAARRVTYGFETRHALMPQFMDKGMPDYMSDDECKKDHMMSHTV